MSQDPKSVEDTAKPVEKAQRYLEDVRLEMKQVNWPSRKEVRSTTLLVLFFTFAMTAFVAVMDGIAEFLYRLIVHR